MSPIRFDAEVIDMGPACAVEVPDRVAEALGGKRVPVQVTIRGFTFPTTTAVMGGRLLIGLNKANREGTGVKAGDKVKVSVERDEQQRVVEPPEELVAGFRKLPKAKATWEALSYTHQREYAEWITGAKKAETRASRAAKALEKLASGAKTYR
jgi:hypothetical protein